MMTMIIMMKLLRQKGDIRRVLYCNVFDWIPFSSKNGQKILTHQVWTRPLSRHHLVERNASRQVSGLVLVRRRHLGHKQQSAWHRRGSFLEGHLPPYRAIWQRIPQWATRAAEIIIWPCKSALCAWQRPRLLMSICDCKPNSRVFFEPPGLYFSSGKPVLIWKCSSHLI